MFKLENIQAAHSKVKSGADFPTYVQELISLGVAGYHVKVSDGKSIYFDKDANIIDSEAKYESIKINQILNLKQFTTNLKAHQDGKTNYMTFVSDCAKSGVYSWKLDFGKMTCTYFDVNDAEVLVEKIPTV